MTNAPQVGRFSQFKRGVRDAFQVGLAFTLQRRAPRSEFDGVSAPPRGGNSVADRDELFGVVHRAPDLPSRRKIKRSASLTQSSGDGL